MLVAERFAGRVASLIDVMCRHLPLEALTVSATQGEEEVSLQFRKRYPRKVSAPPPKETDAELGFRKKIWFPAIEAIFSGVHTKDPDCQLSFRRGYIAAQRHGGTYNFFAAHSRSNGFLLEVKLPPDTAVAEELAAAGLSVGSYKEGKPARAHFPVAVPAVASAQQLSTLRAMVLRAYDRWTANSGRQA